MSEQNRKARDARQREQREADVRELSALPAGQRVFYDLLDRVCGTFGGVMPAGPVPDVSIAMAFNEGRRSVGMELISEFQRVAPQQYQAMVLEAIRTQNFDAATRAAEAVPGPRDGLPR